jgi:hypothetical protein
MLRYVVPLLGLMLLAIFATLYAFEPNAYYRTLETIGIQPFKYPFLDWEYIGASIKCWNEGINVYITDPCDVLNRVHDGYSPLWLRAVFLPTDRAWTMPTGIGIVLTFLLSLFWVVKPANWREVIVFVLACTSTMVVFALERTNVDVIFFIMFVVAGVLSSGSLASRILSYALMLLAGLLKFYPLTLLSTTLRERPRTFLVIVAASSLIIVGFVYRFREELAAGMRNIPHWGYTENIFGSVNLPFGLPIYMPRVFPELDQFAWFTKLPYAIMAVLLIVTAVQVIHLARNGSLASAFVKMPKRDAMFLVIGAALIVGCFFAGQNNGYKGVHLIFVVAGLLAMRRVADNRMTGATLSLTVMIVVFLMWQGLFSRILQVPGPWYAFFWLIREVLWWRLAAVLLAVLVIFGLKSEVFAALQRWRGPSNGISA